MAKLVEHIGNYTAVIEVVAPGNARLSWFNSDGKKLKSAPRMNDKEDQQEHDEFKKKFKSIKDTLIIQTRRIESFYIEGFKTSIDEWRKYYVDHPLLNTISSGLIWNFEVGNNIYSAFMKEKKLYMANGIQLDILPSHTLVSLWHPLLSNSKDCDAWRNYIWTNAIVQPFRQAFREIYLESSDRNNQLDIKGLYVRQHQFRSLLLSRGWNYQLRGNFESDSAPELNLRSGVVCEIGISGTSTASSSAGISLAIQLSQIKFSKLGKVLSSGELPSLEYSEVMRDIDLFTSIAGVGYHKDWDQIEKTHSEIRESSLIEKIAKVSGQTSIICNELVLNNDPLESVIVKFLCAMDVSMEQLPIPETVKTRSLLLGLMLKGSAIFDKVNIEGRYVYIDNNNDGGYRINLASGLVFCARDNRLLPVPVRRKAITGTVSSDTLLSRIYSLILTLANDKHTNRQTHK